MGYYRSGDYYGAGDPFLGLGSILGIGKKVLGGLFGGGGRATQVSALLTPPHLPQLPTMAGAVVNVAAEGARRLWEKKQKGAVTGMPRRRRMNVTNPKALRRAIRRQTGFVKLAKRALKGSGYRIVSSSYARPRTKVYESGPGDVTVQGR